jgi:hypothetical protein
MMLHAVDDGLDGIQQCDLSLWQVNLLNQRHEAIHDCVSIWQKLLGRGFIGINGIVQLSSG